MTMDLDFDVGMDSMAERRLLHCLQNVLASDQVLYHAIVSATAVAASLSSPAPFAVGLLSLSFEGSEDAMKVGKASVKWVQLLAQSTSDSCSTIATENGVSVVHILGEPLLRSILGIDS